jgi:hypothetical protein
MIRYALACEAGHEFDSWFASADAFDELGRRGLNACPRCGSSRVAKQLMAPAVSTSRRKASPPADATEAASPEAETPVAAPPALPMITDHDRKLRAMLRELHAHVRANTEDVGGSFPDQALKMHTGEIEHRAIRGQATPDEAAALREQGVMVAPLPPLPDDLN